MKKWHLCSFLLGLASSSALCFYVFQNLPLPAFETFLENVMSKLPNPYAILIFFFLIPLPLFIIFILILLARPEIKVLTNKTHFVLLALLIFELGVGLILAYFLGVTIWQFAHRSNQVINFGCDVSPPC